jgi:uncharacterized protein (DUF2062 family)
MPRRFFRKFAVKRDSLKDRWWLAPFEHLLSEPNLWVIRRRTVVPAFALGLFTAYLPFPGHIIIGALLAIPLRVNLPVAALSTLINNPVTIGPMFYAAFELGRQLLRLPPRDIDFEFSLDWLFGGFAYIWQPLMLGSILLGAILAVVGFVTLDLIWRASIWDYLKKRRARRKAREL